MKGREMRAFTVQIDGGLDGHAEGMLAAFILAMPVGDHGVKFKGDLHTGVIVNHRRQGLWTVSFRPSPAGQNARQYNNPRAVARAIIEHKHNAEAIN
jgi:hypothetical protein